MAVDGEGRERPRDLLTVVEANGLPHLFGTVTMDDEEEVVVPLRRRECAAHGGFRVAASHCLPPTSVCRPPVSPVGGHP